MEQMKVYAGLDMHSETITGTIKDSEGNPLRVLKVETSQEGVKKLFTRFKKKQVCAVFEASKNWPYYSQLLKPYCGEVVMAHPLKIRAIASARIKTDAIDSNVLCDLLRGNLIPESYMPSLEIVELRELLRYRSTLSNLRARFKTKVRNIISREGKKCEWKDITAKGARLWLNNVLLNDLNRRELESNKNLVECLPPVIDMVA